VTIRPEITDAILHAKLPKPTGTPCHIFAGSGFSGKSFTAKFLIDHAMALGRTLAVAEMDPSKRELVRTYGADVVMQPMSTDASGQETPTNDPAVVAHWCMRYLDWVMAQPEKHPVLLEFGGGDTALQRLVAMAGDLRGALEGNGFSPVMWHFLTPRVEDLGTLAALERAKFQPPHTVLVMSDALLRQADPAEAFGRVEAHPVYKAARSRGAILIRLPALAPELASEIDHGMRFSNYAEHMRRLGSGGLMVNAMTSWVRRMQEALHPVEDCLL